MRKIEVYVETNKTGSRCSTVIEVDDDATDDEIERPAREAMFEMIEWGWRVPEDGEIDDEDPDLALAAGDPAALAEAERDTIVLERVARDLEKARRGTR